MRVRRCAGLSALALLAAVACGSDQAYWGDDPSAGSCQEGDVRLELDVGYHVCLRSCGEPGGCPAGYACEDTGGGVTACVRSCNVDWECLGLGACNTRLGFCTLPGSSCGEGIDGDEYGPGDCTGQGGGTGCLTVSCHDTAGNDAAIYCARRDEEPLCLDAPEVVCAAALAGTGTIEGDTELGKNTFSTTCGDGDTGEGQEQLYVYTAPVERSGQPGRLTLRLRPREGHVMYVRRQCTSQTLACAALEAGELDVPLVAGESLIVFVDAVSSGEEGTYWLDFTFTPDSL
ncbi:uncharacterized protein SOCE26_048170 [Sorangium cellulosum]|uniref:Secreted protein n=1 Tax=Sorangium cellulosum TaxID=56 RepID=A0A2L0EVT1_SORCE|nr:hypothetical protein [Sorangium cellulosum]AUX43369.1 uncharacterized protein SOCE26_048170 [Sorangium cellulosum]